MEDYALLKGVQENLAYGAKAVQSRSSVGADVLVSHYRSWWRKAIGRDRRRVWFGG